jgi:Eukaryotic aspartyl protease
VAKTPKNKVPKPAPSSHPARNVRSAAAALGGKMSQVTVQMPITNVLMDGDYTGIINVGSKNLPISVILDTGSSTLAIDGTAYDPTKDSTAQITDLAQEVAYGDGSNWVGGVVQTNIAVGSGQPLVLPKVYVAVAYHASQTMFQQAQGILGLAYTKLNNAFLMPGPTIPPHYTFNQIQSGKVTYIEPYFTQLESAGLVANKFAFYTLRSMINMATSNPKTDPLNNGSLILGGGEEYTNLYTGTFQVARVVDDLYYNVNLKSITVGKTAPITVTAPTKASGNVSNSIVDTGTNGIYLDSSVFNEVLARFSPLGLEDAFRAGYLPMTQVNLAQWPTLTFVLEGALGPDVTLQVAPDTYWQTNSPKAGYATAVLFSGSSPSILGLPLMNNYFTVFDRSVDKGLGVVSFAPINAQPAGQT